MSLTDFIYKISILGASHKRKIFSCGELALDRYLCNQASQDIKKHVAAVFVLTEKQNLDVIGYYTLSAMTIMDNELPESLRKNLPKYNLLPTTLLGRLAVDKQYQRRGLGELLLANALRRSISSSKEIAAMAIIVDAKNEAAVAFYEHYGFIRLASQKKKLYLSMETALQVCGSK
jgi:GNAT superfamily N-acetyltransferase